MTCKLEITMQNLDPITRTSAHFPSWGKNKTPLTFQPEPS